MKEGCIIKTIKQIIDDIKINSSIAILTARSIEPLYLEKFITKKFNFKSVETIAVNNIKAFDIKLKELKTLNDANIGYIFLKRFSSNKNVSIKKILETKKSAIKKALAIIWFVNKGYSEIYFYDDSLDNIKAVDEIAKIGINLNIKIITKFIEDNDRMECIKKIKEKLDKNKIYVNTNLNSSKCKDYLKSAKKKII